MKKLFILVGVGVMAVGGFFVGKYDTSSQANVYEQSTKEDSLKFNEQLIKEGILKSDDSRIEIVDSCDLSLENLRNRNGKIIVEKVIGEVVDLEGNGKILNANDKDHDYISYKSHLEDFEVGDTVVSYCIYNPDTSYEDDIIERFDYIVDRLGE